METSLTPVGLNSDRVQILTKRRWFCWTGGRKSFTSGREDGSFSYYWEYEASVS
jgi:hypothetical protein